MATTKEETKTTPETEKTGSEETKKKETEPASLQLCNLVSQGMTVAEAKKALGM